MPRSDNPDLRSAIREAIDRLGISQAEAARRAAVAPTHLCAYLGGGREMRSDSVERLLAALGLVVRPGRRPAKRSP